MRRASRLKSLPVVAPLTLILCGLLVAACGSSNSNPDSSQSRSSAAASGSYLKADADDDRDDRRQPGSDDDAALLASYGSEASPAEAGEVTAVVRRYYSAATAEDGPTACALLYASLEAGLGEGEQHVAGKSCPAAVSRLFKAQHSQLIADDSATMVVTGVHVKGGFGLATLGFKSQPEAEILLEREGGTWKLAALFSSVLP